MHKNRYDSNKRTAKEATIKPNKSTATGRNVGDTHANARYDFVAALK